MQDKTPATHHVVMESLALPSALLASVSHDLRGPLSVIRGASEVLHEGFAHLADEDRHAYLRAIRRECVRMDEYIHGLFNATRLLVGGSARLVRAARFSPASLRLTLPAAGATGPGAR